MTLRKFCFAILAAGTLITPAARADAIDGAWCHGERGRLMISGPRIVTAAGNTLQGEYGRHSFRYVVPGSEPGAGETVEMLLVSEEMIRVRDRGGEVTWRRCGPPTS